MLRYVLSGARYVVLGAHDSCDEGGCAICLKNGKNNSVKRVMVYV